MTTPNNEKPLALFLLMISRLYTSKSVLDATEIEKRVFINVPPRKRSFRVLTSTWTREEEPIIKSPKNSIKNKRQHSPKPKKAKHMIDSRFEGEASSSGTREPPPEWLVRLMRSKNGQEPKKIIEKPLTATDVASVQGRLSMPFSQITDLEFLSPTEVKIIQEDLKKLRKKGVDAKLVSFDLREFDVNLRRWDMKKESGGFTPLYNLVKGWNQVVQDCCLKKNDNICLWSFHSNGQLYFALVLPKPSGDSGESKSKKRSSDLVTHDKTNSDLHSK